MARSGTTIKRMGGAPDLASRALVFGEDANADALICVKCQHGEKEEWTPTMKKSRCPVCGNREGHKLRRKGK
ncbi:MAG: hypothetical protein LBC90_04560 [Candidatus Adiutrix sp.]|jgi:hypothetical protein|nr:hypothetical protein [Candidatus Adiutrix sp.]